MDTLGDLPSISHPSLLSRKLVLFGSLSSLTYQCAFTCGFWTHWPKHGNLIPDQFKNSDLSQSPPGIPLTTAICPEIGKWLKVANQVKWKILNFVLGKDFYSMLFLSACVWKKKMYWLSCWWQPCWNHEETPEIRLTLRGKGSWENHKEMDPDEYILPRVHLASRFSLCEIF